MLPAWVPEIESKPAPGDLLLLQAFVNTFEEDTGIDVLSEEDGANAWLHLSGLVPAGARLGRGELDRLRDVREALRSLLVHNAGFGEATAADLRLLAEARGESAVELNLVAEDNYRMRAQPVGADPVGVAVVRLLLIIRDAQVVGTWARLKACTNTDCRWAFYDRTHSQKGRWCDMATCGNRLKNRALRARRQSARES